MPIDKSWIDWRNRVSDAYFAKLDEFLDFAYSNKDVGSSIYCPCRKCKNRAAYVREVVQKHLRDNGFWVTYKLWTKHGETIDDLNDEPVHMDELLPETDGYMEVDMAGLVEDAIGRTGISTTTQLTDDGENDYATPGPTKSTKKFLKLMEGANRPLYPGSKKQTALSFVVRLLQAKSLHRWTINSFEELLDIFSETLPDGANLPKSYYQAQKLVDDLGFNFRTVDACPNNCMLFRNEDAHLDECLVCNASRWRETISGSDSGTRRAVQQARYFPLTPRLQRLYAIKHTASLMKWHGLNRVDDGVFRHPADSPAWKHLDAKHPSFGANPRNVRLGIASDGFNPFHNQNNNHSVWPVILVPYNLPPMYILKHPYIYLSVLIDGPKGPGDKIDVYLEPLIEELKVLWEEGIQTFDASTNQMFQMRAALLWSINDFPAYANLSGWSTKGEYACPNCNTRPCSTYLFKSHKWSYGKSRRFLPYDHKYRKNKKSFYYGCEDEVAPSRLTGDELLAQLHAEKVLTQYKREDMILIHQMGPEKPEKDPLKKKKHNWKKKSILFELPYWKDNLMPHSIDTMHVEKNFAENVLYTIMGVKGKTKDNVSARRDLEDFGIRKQYHVKKTEANIEYYERAEFEMDNDGKDKFLQGLSNARMPDGSCSSIAQRVNLNERTITTGLKSHDFHILIQQLISLCVRSSLPSNVVSVLVDVARFFKVLCSKTNSSVELEEARSQIIVTLCDIEQIFPMSFLDVMEHLPIHLAEEALIGGAVQFRWMYSIERFLYTLKTYVKQPACPESSLSRGYLLEECMSFCAHYLRDVETKSSRPPRRKSDDEKKGKSFILPELTHTQIHRWILFHTDAITPYLGEYLNSIRNQYPTATEESIAAKHFNEFPTQKKVVDVFGTNAGQISSLSQSAQTIVCGVLNLDVALDQTLPPQQLSLAPAHEPSQQHTTPSSSTQQPQQQVVVRGHNKGVLGWNNITKIQVEWNEKFHPVGDNSSKLVSQLGLIVRDGHRLPLTYLDWNGIPEPIKDGIWAEVQANVVDVPQQYREVLMSSLKTLWRGYKAKTKKTYFKPFENDPDILKKCPPKVLPDQWVQLVQYWKCPNVKEQAEKNSRNRDKHGPLHVTGRKSFATLKHELQKNGEPVDKMSVWIRARNIDDHDVKKTIADNNDLLSKKPEDQRELLHVKDKIFHQLIGPDGHGYCRTYGSSAPPQLVYQGSSSAASNNEALFRQILQEFSEAMTQHFDKKIELLRDEMMLIVGGMGRADGATTHSQTQAASAQLRESIGDDIVIVYPNKSRQSSPEEETNCTSSSSHPTEDDDEATE